MASDEWQVTTDGHYNRPLGWRCTSNYCTMGLETAKICDGVYAFTPTGGPPQGATIDLAKIKLYKNTKSGNANGDFYGEDEDAGNGCGAGNAPVDRNLTSASVNGDNPCDSAGWNEHTITSIIQEIVNRPGYSQGNAITILWIEDGTSPAYHRADSLEKGATTQAKLYIEWTVAAGQQLYCLINMMGY